MTDIPLLRIGEFSRASSLSVKTLRAYHEAGLLVPAVVDPQTSYRSYSVEQLTDAAVIRRLRQLDLPLEGIRAVLDARDPAVTSKVLEEHGTVLQERISAMQAAISELYVAVVSPALHTPIHRRADPGRTVLTYSQTVTEAEWMPFLDEARTLLLEVATTGGAVVAGGFGAWYPTLLDDDAQDVTAFIPVSTAILLPERARARGVKVDEIPETEVAVLAHRGSYDDLADSYQQLGAWVATNAQPLDRPVREEYLVGPAQTSTEGDWRTELCWPVR